MRSPSRSTAAPAGPARSTSSTQLPSGDTEAVLSTQSLGNAIPERVPCVKCGLDGLRAFIPHLGVLAAQIDQHLHGHWRVLFPVDLDMPGQIILERTQIPAGVVDADDLLEHLRDEIFPPECERRRLAVDRS